MNITKRIDLNLGYTCNIKCRFCYYQESMCGGGKSRDITTAQAKKWLSFFRKKGIEEIDLTGGEPTIRKDIIELTAYCRKIGYKKICVITNGFRMADRGFTAGMAKNGLNDVLFSLHGPTAAIHDDLTRVPGSYDKLMQAVENAVSLGLRCRSNTVVNGVSYRHLKETAEVLRNKGIKAANFILFNPIVEAQSSDADMNLSYKDAAPYLREVIDSYKDHLEKITVRYIPFCLLPGYEKYITNTPQIQYDPDEWDYVWRTYFRNGPFLWCAAFLVGFLVHPDPARMFTIPRKQASHETLKWGLAFKNKIKSFRCRFCAYYRICDGLWRDYTKRAGFSELRPFNGPKISDPAFFLGKRD